MIFCLFSFVFTDYASIVRRTGGWNIFSAREKVSERSEFFFPREK